MYKILLCTLLFYSVGFAQSYWQPVSESELVFLEKANRNSHPRDYQLFYLDLDIFKQQLQDAPIRGAIIGRSSHLIWLPNKGKLERFHVIETPIMEDELAERYPMIKSYAAQGVDSPGAVARFSVTQLGLHNMIFNTDSSTEFIDPYTVDKQYYIVYKRSDLDRGSNTFECKTDEPDRTSSTELDRNAFDYDILNADDNLLRTYRLALSCTAEYGNIFAGTGTLAQQKANIQAQMAITMTRVNGVYEIDLGITMIFVANNDEVIFLGATNADPWSNEWNTTTAQTLDSIIGVNNYDIGHNFNTTGGGNAGCIACVCRAVSQSGIHKGRGYTGSSNPTGDPFDIDYVAHEMGHQFGGFHTQSNNSCRSGSGQTEVEPGSASTIMGYAGICAANIQSNSDAYFAYVNIRDIMAFVKSPTGSCSVNTPIGNQAPIVSAGSDYTIPRSTPFILTAEGFDPDGDELTYTWEQRDPQNPSSNAAPIPTRAVGPMFRSIWGTTSPSRFMPNLQTVLAGNTANTWEVVPSVARTMTFSVVARDNVAGGGQTSSDLMTVTVSGTAGPFVVNSPNTNVSWQAGSNQTVTWDVAGTTANGVDATFVDIYISGNGGTDFNTLLASQVPNDGSELVTMPSATGNQHRIMVRGHNHVFYDVSNTNFTVSSTDPTFSLSFDREAGGQNKQVCQGQEVSYAILYETLGGFSETTTFSVSGQPAGVTVDFSPSTISSDGTVVMAFSDTDEAVPGFYEMTVTGTSGSISKQVRFYLEVLNTSQDVVILSSPLHLSTNVNPLLVLLEWNSIATSNQFELQLATDLDFEQLVSTQNITGTSLQVSDLEGLQNYFWRVRPLGALCNQEFSDVYRFTTTTVDCNSFSSTNVPVTIPTTAATVNSTLTVLAAENQLISSLTVDINITHTWINDLIVTLISPSGTQVRLLNRPCPSSSQYQNAIATFTMDGISLACNLVPQNAVSGNVNPFDSFSSLVGQNTQGTWTLRVQDVFNDDGGSINDWTLNFCTDNDNTEIACGQLNTTWDGLGWSNGFPVNNVQANILDDLELNRDMEVCSLNIGENVQMTVVSGNNLIVGNEVTIAESSGLTVQSNANLIQINEASNSGIAEILRNTSPLMRLDYVLWSSPVVGLQTLKEFSPLTLNNRFYTYNSATNQYNVVPNPVTTTFGPGAGYLIRMPDNHPTSPTPWPGRFEGTPFNGYLEVPLNYFGPGAGYNLVGNPYPSTLNAEAFLTQNAEDIQGTLYFWRKTNNAPGTAYATYTLGGATTTSPTSPIPNGTIQVGQGFFVAARNVVQPKVIFDNSMRVDNNNNQFFRTYFGMSYTVTTSFEKHRFWLNLTHESGLFSQMMVGYMEGATLEEDPLLDGRFIGDSSQSLTSLIDANPFAVQARPLPFEVADVVPLQFQTNTTGTYQISLGQADGLFEAGQAIYLRDLLTQTVHDFSDGAYAFSSVAGSFSNRFEIIYQNETLGIGDVSTHSGVQVVSRNDLIQVRSTGELIQQVTIYDVLGRIILLGENTSNDYWNSVILKSGQVLLVRVRLSDGSVTTHKVVH